MALRVVCFCVAGVSAAAPGAAELAAGETRRLGFESEAELLADFVSRSEKYAPMGRQGLAERGLSIVPGRFGNAVHIADGWPVSKGTWNESGLDCDLIVAVVWGEWHTKPHYWGSGAFHGERGTVAFWVKADTLHPGVVFMQGSVAWGRKERDLFTVEVDAGGRLSAHIRDVRSAYHRVESDAPVWTGGEWQHIAVAYDNAYGLRLYHNGTLVGSTWGEDAWWLTTYPGLFSPFMPESYYDEVRFFDVPLSSEAIAELYRGNTVPEAVLRDSQAPLDTAAQDRLLAAYGDVQTADLPTIRADEAALSLTQIVPAAIHDEAIPAEWVFDGRYELAWPHPYRLFTFILGDADFHGTKIDMDFRSGTVRPNFIQVEGTLEDIAVFGGQPGAYDASKPLVVFPDDSRFFHARPIGMAGFDSLRIPLTKRHGSPEGLEGSARIPLSGETRIHEIHLWHARSRTGNAPGGATWALAAAEAPPRYRAALAKIKGSRSRTTLVGTATAAPGTVPLRPLEAVHFMSPPATRQTAASGIRLQLAVAPAADQDMWWLRVRDPANPARLWAQACVRAEYSGTGIQSLDVSLDVVDVLLAPGDSLWIEVMAVQGGTLHVGDADRPTALTLVPAHNLAAATAEYADHALRPARMQYMKEYNYRPWLFTGDTMTVESWPVFGGPFDMAYPPLAVLRHDPDNRLATMYRTLTLERPWFGRAEDAPMPSRPPAPPGAPDWAVWQRELYALNQQTTHWIVDQQRDDGMFWGGSNDDPFIVLGWAALPLLGDEKTRASWLRFYEGLEEMGIFHDGYCDIWPIDPLHITDFIASRPLTMSFALGDPHVVERELRMVERYGERVAAANARRAAQGLPPLTGDPAMRDAPDVDLIDQMDAEIHAYGLAHLEWFWGNAPQPEPHTLPDRAAVAAAMRDTVRVTDETALFGFTQARVHTDNQRGIGRELLVSTALGGRIQGRAQPQPNEIAVSWEGVETADLARLVSYADSETLRVNLYNFRTAPLDVTMRVWRLRKGLYRVQVGPDDGDDGRIDAVPPAGVKHAALGRFRTLSFRVPPRQNTAVEVALVTAHSEPAALPDLAVSERGLAVLADGTLEVTVHNIGAAPARDAVVAVVNSSGEIVAGETIAELPSPREAMAAQRTTLRFPGLILREGLHVQLDPKGGLPEISRENNAASVGAILAQ